MKIGSARVSVRAQNVALQRKVLTYAGCGPIQDEKASGVLPARVELGELPRHLRPDNTVHSHQLDRSGRFVPARQWFRQQLRRVLWRRVQTERLAGDRFPGLAEARCAISHRGACCHAAPLGS